MMQKILIRKISKSLKATINEVDLFHRHKFWVNNTRLTQSNFSIQRDLIRTLYHRVLRNQIKMINHTILMLTKLTQLNIIFFLKIKLTKTLSSPAKIKKSRWRHPVSQHMVTIQLTVISTKTV